MSPRTLRKLTLSLALQVRNLDLDLQGDVSAEVLLPAGIWAQLVEAARVDAHAHDEARQEGYDRGYADGLGDRDQIESSGREVVDVLAFVGTDRSNDVIALRAKVAQLEAVIATSQNIPELVELRAFRGEAITLIGWTEESTPDGVAALTHVLKDRFLELKLQRDFRARVIDALGEEPGNPDSIDLIERVKQFREVSTTVNEELEQLRAFKTQVQEFGHVGKHKRGMQSSVDVEEFDRELARLRAFALAVREEVFGIDPKAWPQSPDLATLTERVKAMSREASESKELLFQLEGLRAFKARVEVEGYEAPGARINRERIEKFEPLPPPKKKRERPTRPSWAGHSLELQRLAEADGKLSSVVEGMGSGDPKERHAAFSTAQVMLETGRFGDPNQLAKPKRTRKRKPTQIDLEDAAKSTEAA